MAQKKLTYADLIEAVQAFCPGLSVQEIWQKLVGTEHAWQVDPRRALKLLAVSVPGWEKTAVNAILASNDVDLSGEVAPPRKPRGRPKRKATVSAADVGPEATK
jgi:hypothetical protein